MTEESTTEGTASGGRAIALRIAVAVLVVLAGSAIAYWAARPGVTSSTEPPETAGGTPSRTMTGTRTAGGSRSPQSPEQRSSDRRAPGGAEETTPARDSAEDSGRPVTTPDTLAPVTRPPARTLAMLDASHADTGAVYDIEFAPYGFGPGAGRTLVIAVTVSKPVGDMRVPFDFTGRNVLADVSGLPDEQRITKGGRYAGRLQLVARGGLLAPVILATRPLE